MPRRSAGIALYRRTGPELEVLLVHPGGPLWARRDAGVWSIPKGEYSDDEEPEAAARREFTEELGAPVPAGELIDLGEVRQPGGKLVRAWAAAGDLDAGQVRSNTFALEWPPRSGRVREYPEVDRAGWFTLEQARERINSGQVPLLERLEHALG
jgi:predicted NUDIX family NTP pyrophosphohydrolase